MPEQLYITSSCIIRNQKVFKNDKLFFENAMSEVDDFLISLYKELDLKYPKFYKMDHLCKLGLLASEILVQDNKYSENDSSGEVAVILSNSNASLDNDINYFNSVSTIASPALFVYTLPNIVIGEICIRNHFHGENTFFVAPKFDAEWTDFYVGDLFNTSNTKYCLCGWVDCIDQEYEAILFWVEKNASDNSMIFNKENILKTVQRGNG